MTRPSSFFVTVLWLPSRWLLTAILLAAPTGYTTLLAQDEPRGALELASTSHAATLVEAITLDRARFRLADGTAIELPTRDIVGWGRLPPWPQGPMVLVAGGGVIAGRLERYDAEVAVVRSQAWGLIEIPASCLIGFRASMAHGPVCDEFLEQTSDAQKATDGPQPERLFRLELKNGDRLLAKAIAIANQVLELNPGQSPPAATSIAGSDAMIFSDGERVGIPLERVQSIDFLAAPRIIQQRPLTLWMALADGSRLNVQSISSVNASDAASVQAESVILVGEAFVTRLKATGNRNQIVAIAVDGGCARWLSTLAPASFVQTPAIGSAWPLAVGCTLDRGWLVARGRTAFAGLGIHAPARLAYRLENPVDRFESLVAIDDLAGQGGSVRVRVLAGRGGDPLREVFVSGVIRGGEQPLALTIPLDQATALELLIETADGGEILDRTLWLDPRLIGR